MQNPDIKGAEYQRGTLYGWQLRHYIFARDRWQCQYCDKPHTKNRTLTLDHIIPESRGGPTVVGNLVTACKRCNTKKTNTPLDAFLAKKPKLAAKIQQQVDKLVKMVDFSYKAPSIHS